MKDDESAEAMDKAEPFAVENIEIREGDVRDLELLVEFQLEMAWTTETRQLERETVKRGISTILSDPNKGFYVVAECEGKVLGVAMTTFEFSDWNAAPYWWFQSVFVKPEYRKTGIFRQIYNFIRERGIKSQAHSLRLYVASDNTLAQNVYKILGFQELPYKVFEESLPKESST